MEVVVLAIEMETSVEWCSYLLVSLKMPLHLPSISKLPVGTFHSSTDWYSRGHGLSHHCRGQSHLAS